jgi:hypothetical protein
MRTIRNPTSINVHLRKHAYTEAIFRKCEFTEGGFRICALIGKLTSMNVHLLTTNSIYTHLRKRAYMEFAFRKCAFM